MADKKKPQLGSASIIPPSRIVDIDSETEESPSGGSPPNVIEGVEYKVAQPPQPPARTTTVSPAYPRKPSRPSLGEGKEYRVALPDGRWVTVNSEGEAKQIAIENYGVSYPTEVIFEVIQPKPEAQRIAKPIQPPSYTRLATQRPIRETPSLLMPKTPEELKKQEERVGPVSPKDLGTVAKMYGELKKAYYESYAGLAQNLQAAKLGAKDASYEAYYIQNAHLRALRYGIHTLKDLHPALDEAGWSFFFRTLGPLGEVLENLRGKEIQFNINYQLGKSWWSPYRMEYLVNHLPEEKAIDFLLDAAGETAYMVGRLGGPKLMAKRYDMYGNELRGKVFVPILKLQQAVNFTGDFLEAISTESSVLKLQNEKRKSFHEQPWNEQKIKTLDKLIEKRETELGLKRLPTKETALPTLFRTFGLKSVSKNLKRTDRDPLSWLSILIAEWIIDLTIGNIIRLADKVLLNHVKEVIRSSSFWQKLTNFVDRFLNNPAVKTSQIAWKTAGHMVRALPSLNTLSGAYSGYHLGRAIGQNIAQLLGMDPVAGAELGGYVGFGTGTAVGWGYQWVLNVAKDPTIMRWVGDYKNALNEIRTLKQEGAFNQAEIRAAEARLKGFSLRISEAELSRLNWWQRGLIRFTNSLLGPGPIQRLAYWLNSPVGSFFRLPIRGLAISQFLSPYEAFLQQYIPWYQNWMPVAADYLWQIKGNLWNIIAKPGVGRFWDYLRFGKTVGVAPGLEYNLLKFEIAEGPGFSLISQAGKTQVLLYKEGGQFLAQPRGWYARYLNFRYSGLPNVFNSFISNFQTAHPGLTNFFKTIRASFRGVGISNLAGAIIGWELASILFPGVFLAPLIGAAIGWFALNPILYAVYRLAAASGLFSYIPLFSRFIGLFNAGFWIGTGIQVVTGLMGFDIPFVNSIFFPLVTGLVFSFAPTILTTIAALLPAAAAPIAAVLTGIAGAITAISTSLIAAVAVTGLIAVVAFTVFAVVLIGAAYWIPISERLEGVTAVSKCFSIDQPKFNGSTLSTFKKGEKKDICWTTTIKEEYYPSQITKTKFLGPPNKFTVGGYSVKVTLPGTTTPIDLIKDQTVGGYGLGYQEQVYRGFKQYVFSITPPLDTSGEIDRRALESIKQLAQAVENGGVANYSENAKMLIVEQIVQDSLLNTQKNLLLQQELAILNEIESRPNITNEEINELIEQHQKTTLDNIVKQTDYLVRFATTSYSGYRPEINEVISNCATSTSLPSCININKNLAIANQLNQQAEGFYAGLKGATPEQRTQAIKQLNDQLKSIDNNKSLMEKQIGYINEIRDTLLRYGANSPELEQKINSLAGSLTQGQVLYKIPQGSVIEVCLKDVVYSGEETDYAFVRESDSAQLPYTPSLGPLGPLTVPSCQAELTTPLNAGPSGGISAWPTGGKPSSLSQGYEPGRHNGIDIPLGLSTPLVSVVNGTVHKKGYMANGFGYYIIIKGKNNDYYLYAHLGGVQGDAAHAYTTGLNEGDSVTAGQVIAYSGTTGKSTGPHLHFSAATCGEVSCFYNGSQHTINPCLIIIGGCPATSGGGHGE
ncbi:M23 family metallopeptidase [Candidatus Microgenomates bacterium]|nr:M23 family metallopeptidase [Candidatus Microgenomates bacterium]